jgi:hypothetical protein
VGGTEKGCCVRESAIVAEHTMMLR